MQIEGRQSGIVSEWDGEAGSIYPDHRPRGCAPVHFTAKDVRSGEPAIGRACVFTGKRWRGGLVALSVRMREA